MDLSSWPCLRSAPAFLLLLVLVPTHSNTYRPSHRYSLESLSYYKMPLSKLATILIEGILTISTILKETFLVVSTHTHTFIPASSSSSKLHTCRSPLLPGWLGASRSTTLCTLFCSIVFLMARTCYILYSAIFS